MLDRLIDRMRAVECGYMKNQQRLLLDTLVGFMLTLMGRLKMWQRKMQHSENTGWKTRAFATFSFPLLPPLQFCNAFSFLGVSFSSIFSVSTLTLLALTLTLTAPWYRMRVVVCLCGVSHRPNVYPVVNILDIVY